MNVLLLGVLALVPLAAVAQAPADADYWLTHYDGADLVSGQYACATPAIPHSSGTNVEETRRVIADYAAWRSCYNAVVQHFDDVNNPVGKVIPKAVLDAMTVEQRTRALDRLEQVYDRRMAEVGERAQRVIQAFDAWKSHTESDIRLATVNARTSHFKAELEMARTQLESLKSTGISSAH